MSAAILDIDCYTIHSWMRSELNLKGNKRDIYAIIYQQSQGGGSYNGSTQALADVVGISKRQVITILRELVEEGLLVKKEYIRNKLKYCDYRALRRSGEKTSPVSKSGEKISPVSQKSGEEISPDLNESGEKTSPRYIYINNNNINNNLVSKKEEQEAALKPKRKSFDEIIEDKVMDDRVKGLLKDYIQMRILNGRKMSNRSLELVIENLLSMASNPNDQITILKNSVRNSWIELYPLKKPNTADYAAVYQSQTPAKPGFNNFKQRKTDLTELEKVLLKT